MSLWYEAVEEELRLAGAVRLASKKGGHTYWGLGGHKIGVPHHRVSSQRQALNIRSKVRLFIRKHSA